MKALKNTGISLTSMMVLLLFTASFIKAAPPNSKNTSRQDTLSYVTYTGKIIDANTKKPVIFASIYKVGTSIGTVSNSDGEFIFKVPVNKNTGNMGVSYIGYKELQLPFNQLKTDKSNELTLEPSPIPIKEVIVRTSDPVELLRMARIKIPENYSDDPAMLTGFYRESIKQNHNYVAVAEAVLDIYKAPYKSDFDNDRVKIYKGRKSMDVKKMDTVLFKLQGGPRTSLLLDVVKNPGELLSSEYLPYYNFKLDGIIDVDSRETYVISFDQKDNVDYPLYAGKIYLDAANLAISGLEFKISDKEIGMAANELVRKRPANMKVDVEGANYLVNYREINGKWYLNHVRSELKFNCKWPRKLFRSNYTTMLEMAVTDRSTENVDKFKASQSAKLSDVFADDVNYFQDPNFWGKYNTIKPDESIESAISKLSRKLKRNLN